jgi:predicted ATPase/class 3 adenylate cyclase
MHQLVPHFILENLASGIDSGNFSAAGLFVDISGFSAMTDALMAHGQHGAEVLAEVMRSAFEPLIRTVYERDGFISTFAGDAFTALFPLKRDRQEAVRNALAAAWEIQSCITARETAVTPYGEFKLSVRVGLALGEVNWGVIASLDGGRAAYYFQGSAIDGCTEAEHRAKSGEILMDEALHGLLLAWIEVVKVEGFYRLSGIKGLLPSAEPYLPPDIDPELQGIFFPRELVEQALSGEFRQVVNLFIMLPTVRTEAQLRIFMQTLFELQDRYGGLLNRLDFGDKGSNLLLFWGVPTAFENDIQRVLDFILDLQMQTSIPINAGVTYQIAHAGFIGSALREEYTCYGRGVNLAARFMTAAPRGEIWADEQIAKGAERWFEIDFEGNQPFKGFQEEQSIYVVLERKEAVAPFFQGKMVGRRSELSRLAEFIAPLGKGEFTGLLVVWGEPGIGKSRLLYEFLTDPEWDVPNKVQVFTAQTDEIVREPFNPFSHWLRAYFGVSAAQVEARNKRSFNRKLDALLEYLEDWGLADELDRTRSCLGALVGLEWPDSLYQQLDAQGRYDNTFIALAALIQAESYQKPAILCLEDAHWLDDDSKAFLSYLARRLTSDERYSYPVAILATARSEKEGILSDLPIDQEINLGGISPGDLAKLANTQLGGSAAPGLLKFLGGWAEGNPFFAEQILSYLQEEGLLVSTESGWDFPGERTETLIPENLNTLLVARLDRLAAGVREVVQTASVLGREFEVRLLALMLHNDPPRMARIKQAERASIWLALNELRYIFKHGMLREAAYNMQVLSRRKALHALAVDALESLYLDAHQAALSGEANPPYAELAYHAEHAGLIQKACEYLQKAAAAAQKSYQNSQAVDYCSRALILSSDPEVRYQLFLDRESVYSLSGQYEPQKADLERLSSLVEEMEASSNSQEQTGRRAVVMSRWAKYTVRTGDHPKAILSAGKALELANSAGDQETALEALMTCVEASRLKGDLDEGLRIAEEGIDLARRTGSHQSEAGLLNLLGLIYLDQGKSSEARACLELGLGIADEIGDRRSKARSLNNLGNLAGTEGSYAAAHFYYLDTLEITREIGDRRGEGLVSGNLGWIARNLGDFAAARSYAEQNIRIAREIGDQLLEAYAMINLSSLSEIAGDYGAALDHAEQSLALSRKIGDRNGEAWSLTCLGHARFQAGYLGEAEEAYQSALAIRRSLDQPNLAAEPLAGLARISLSLNQLSAAQAYLDDIFTYLEGGETLEGTEEPLRVYLTCYHILNAVGDVRADRILETAYHLLQDRAALIPEESQRRSFMENIPYHQDILKAWESRQRRTS